jgi:hypothetical protein
MWGGEGPGLTARVEPPDMPHLPAGLCGKGDRTSEQLIGRRRPMQENLHGPNEDESENADRPCQYRGVGAHAGSEGSSRDVEPKASHRGHRNHVDQDDPRRKGSGFDQAAPAELEHENQRENGAGDRAGHRPEDGIRHMKQVQQRGDQGKGGDQQAPFDVEPRQAKVAVGEFAAQRAPAAKRRWPKSPRTTARVLPGERGSRIPPMSQSHPARAVASASKGGAPASVARADAIHGHCKPRSGPGAPGRDGRSCRESPASRRAAALPSGSLPRRRSPSPRPRQGSERTRPVRCVRRRCTR